MKYFLIHFAIINAFALSSALADVNFSDDFAANSLSSYNNINGGISWSATSGVSGGGGLSVINSGNPSASTIYNTSFTFDTGIPNQIAMSVFLQKSPSGFGGTSQAFLGVSDESAYSWGANANAGYSAIGLALTSSQIGIRSAVLGGVSGNAGLTGSANYINNDWYKLTAIITKPTSGNTWTVSGSVEDWGATGASFVSTDLTLGDTAVTIADATFNDAATADYGQFGTRNQAWSAVDNFTIAAVPEPSAAALLVVGALGSAVLRLRSRMA
jgi:hypothetical protein